MAIPINPSASAVVQDAILGLNLLTGTLAADIVGIYNQDDFTQLFQKARPIKAYIRETSRVMEYPLENGAIVADHKIIDPRQIDLMITVAAPDYSGTFQQIRQAWLNSQLLIVQTKAAGYQNMIIKDIPREEGPERFNLTTINLQLKEVLFPTDTGTTSSTSVSYYSPASPNDQTQVPRGLVNSITAASSVLSAIHAASVWGIIK